MVRASAQVVRLCWLIALLAAVAASVGAFSRGGDGPRRFVTLNGDTVELYGRGLYRADTTLIATGSRGTDVVTLLFEVPLLLLALRAYRRGSVEGTLLLTGTLGYFLYYYASMALGVAYNPLFLLYVALFSMSLYAFIGALTSIEAQHLPLRLRRFPRRGVLAYLITLAAVFPLVWLPEPVLGLVRGRVPLAVASYTTLPVWVLDLGVVAPAAAIAAVLLKRQQPWGYLLAAVILVLNVTLGVALLGQAAAQLMLGPPLSAGELVAFVLSFAVMTAVAAALAVRVLRPPPMGLAT
jgi:hypothetical protein